MVGSTVDEKVAERQALLKERELDTSVRKPADAERYAVEVKAEGEKSATIRRAEASREATIASAEAKWDAKSGETGKRAFSDLIRQELERDHREQRR